MAQIPGLNSVTDGDMPADVAVLAAGPEASRMALDDEHTTPDAPLNGSRAASGSSILGTKRKLRDPDAEAGLPGAAGSQTPLKKTRLARDHSAQPWTAAGSSLSLDRSLLPPEIWHHIFTFCPPKSLGKLLAVNKLFNLYLDPASSSPRDVPGSATRGVLEPMEPNAIWQASRRLFWSHMPAPLRSKTELDMWRLACSPRCQECGKLDARERSGRPDPRHPGPGPEGVTAIWTFGSRLCGSCLLKSSIKDIDLLISSSLPSAVIPALPFVFITQDLDAFSATTLEQGQLPPSSPVTKWFSSSDVKALEEEFAQVRDMGQGTVGEWLKGLDGRGSALQHDASKWEKWELSGGTAKMCSQLYPGYARKVPLPQPQKLTTDGSLSLPTLRQSLPLGRHERTAEEIVELKAARRAEIERRALLLDPPLTADVLRHIPSFQAATQIVARFDDAAWERLKPRLLAQRADAEKLRDGELAAKSEPKQDRREQRRLEVTLATTMEARDRIDKAWEEAQAPLRAKIAGFADDVIRDSWGKGKKVTRENCSRFAVDALLQVRARFYAEVAKEAAAARAAGRKPTTDPPEGPFTQKLTLENMKWIFDTKIKPHTEPFRKELFYCSGCVGNFKQFGFEGVIQHYAAKHTNALSLGSIVVHWRAEWPARPPFSATARPPKATFNPHARSGYAVNGGAPPFAGYNYPPQQGTMPAPPAAYPPAMGYGYATQTNNDYYQQPPHPPQPYQPSPIAPHFPPQPGYDQQPSYPPPPPTAYPPYQPPIMPYPGATAEPAQSFIPPPGGHYNHQYGTYQPSSTGDSYAPSQPSAFPDPYRTKVEDIARNSREVWRVLGDIKDLPGSVRVFVTIHHLVKRFRSRFYETPPLTMFIDGLSNNKEMRPVRNVNGLVCKACHLGLGNANTVEQDRKRFSLPQLANHFQSKHVEPAQMMQAQTTPAPLDWVVDMVLLPDLTVLSHLASSISKAQRALLAAAIPSAFAPQPVSTTAGELPEQQQALEPPPSAAEGCQSMAATARDASSTSNGNPTSSAAKDESSTVSKSMGVDHHSSAQSSLIATPGAMSDNGHSSAGNEKGGHSSRQSRLVHGQDGCGDHAKATGNDNRGNLEDTGGRGDRVFGRGESTTADESRLREGQDARAVRTAYPGVTTAVHLPASNPEQPGTVGPSLGQASEQPNSQPSRRLEPREQVPPVNADQGSNIMAALESRLEQRRLPQFQVQQGRSSAELPTYRHVSAAQYDTESYPQLGDRAGRARSPGGQPQYRADGLRVEGSNSSGRQVDVTYYSGPAPGGVRHDAYSPGRTHHAGFSESPVLRSEERRFRLPDSRANSRSHGTVTAETEYYRHHEDMRMPPRPPIEAYEIVQVIDEHGEYYIRRPVRRHPDARYVYDERRVHRDIVSSAAAEPGYAPVSRSSLPREAVQARPAAGSWPADRGADSAYYEEYDPRFPAA